MDLIDLRLFHLKVCGGGRRNGRFFEGGGEGPNSRAALTERDQLMSSPPFRLMSS